MAQIGWCNSHSGFLGKKSLPLTQFQEALSQRAELPLEGWREQNPGCLETRAKTHTGSWEPLSLRILGVYD